MPFKLEQLQVTPQKREFIQERVYVPESERIHTSKFLQGKINQKLFCRI